MMEFAQHLRVRAKGRMLGSSVAPDVGAFPRHCLCSEWDLWPPAERATDQGFQLVLPNHARKSLTGFRSFPHICAGCFRSHCCALSGGRSSSSLYAWEETCLVLFDDVPTWKTKHIKTLISPIKVSAWCTPSYECSLCSGGITSCSHFSFPQMDPLLVFWLLPVPLLEFFLVLSYYQPTGRVCAWS